MNFRTELKLLPSTSQIDHRSKIITLGSCFSNVIGEKLSDLKFKVSVNPFGIIYNPISIFNTLIHTTNNKVQDFDKYLVQRNGLWFHSDYHSELFGESKEDLSAKINNIKTSVYKTIMHADYVTITLGTAFVYKFKTENHIVANCHKQPSSLFSKELLTPEDIVACFNNLYVVLKKINPKLKFIFTLSPVRHIKDSIPLNSVSKSILRYAVHMINGKYTDTEYFPAYELMMDDLRDYRFYKSDLLHPTEMAETYIWEKFQDVYMTEETKKLTSQWNNIIKAIQHKPFHMDSDEYKTFARETIAKIKGFDKYFNINEELGIMEKRLNE